MTWLQHHALQVLAAYYLFSSAVSALPPLPDDAGYWGKWGFTFLHLLAADWKQVLATAKIPQPIPEPGSTLIKTEINQTRVENKTTEVPKETNETKPQDH